MVRASLTSTSSPSSMMPMRSLTCTMRLRSCVMNRTEKPSCLRSTSMRWRISRCTTTSSAVVGSSMMSSLGLSARQMAMTIRWRMPPEH
ncbi:hypothetical protein D3C72_2026170 [compost metagenome]